MSKLKNFIEKLNTSQTLLGLDFGDKTIGIAVSDKTHTIASPIKTIKRKSINKDLDELFSIIYEYNVGGLVYILSSITVTGSGFLSFENEQELFGQT